MNWLKVLACLLVAVALALFIAALVTPWYRVRHHDGTTTHMGLYNSYDEHDNHTDAHNDTTHAYDSTPSFHRHISVPIARLAQLTSAKAEEQDVAGDWSLLPASDLEPDLSRVSYDDPYPPHTQQVRRRRALQYNDGWVTAMRVLLIITIVVSFLLLCWSIYQAFVHGTSYGWGDGPYMRSSHYLAYMLLFWAFMNGIIILSLATANGPRDPGRRYDQGYGFNTAAFLLLLFSMCILCWPVSTPVILVSDPYGPYYGARQLAYGPEHPATTFGGAPYGKTNYASTETTTPATQTTRTGTGTVPTGTGTPAPAPTQPYTQIAPELAAGAPMPVI